VLLLRGALEADPGAEWRALARRLMGAVDGERLTAALLARSFASLEGMPIVPVPKAAPAPAPAPAPRSVAAPRATPFEPRDRPRDRPRFGDRDRDRGRPERAARPERGRRDERPAPRPERRDPPPLRNDAPPVEREFWEVWSDERAQAGSSPTTTAPAATAAPASTAAPANAAAPAATTRATPAEVPGEAWRAASEPSRGDIARLYLNLGRKDGASEREIRDLLTTHAGDVAVSEIDVMNTHTYLNVAPADAERVIAALTGKEIAGRQLVCESAKPRRR
jgi:DbpA RNA binding domain